MTLDSMVDLEADLAGGSPPADVTVRDLAAEFEGISEIRVRKIVKLLGLTGQHFFGDSMSFAAAGLVRRELRSRGARAVGARTSPPDWSPRPPTDIVAAAVMVAGSSSGRCKKSLRGAVIYDPSSPLPVLALGRNAPPPGYVCDGSEACRAACGKICEHAEAAALRSLPRGPCLLGGVGVDVPVDGKLELVHAKVLAGELVAGGPPSCWQCSKALLADGRIGGVWLYRASAGGRLLDKPGLAPPTAHHTLWVRYTVDEFHWLTLEACGLPTATRADR